MIRWRSRFKNGQLYHPLAWLTPQENRFNMLTRGKIWIWQLEPLAPVGGGWSREDWTEIFPNGTSWTTYLFYKPH